MHRLTIKTHKKREIVDITEHLEQFCGSSIATRPASAI